MVNSGRLSVATVYDSPLSTPDRDPFAGSARLGAPVPDAPMRDRSGRDGFLIERLTDGFELLYVKNGGRPNAPAGVKLTVIGDDLIDTIADSEKIVPYLDMPLQHVSDGLFGW